MLKTKSEIEPIDYTINAIATKTVAKYLHHLRSITIIRQMIPLIIASQQHRGANLALLEGDASFQDKVAILQDEIDSRFATLQLLNKELSTPVPELEIRQLWQEWVTVREWSGGSVLENYNLHSHFVEQLMRLVWYIAEKTNHFSFALSKDQAGPKKVSQYDEALSGDALLVKFILSETPELIELIARIRGLATHAAVSGVCDSEHNSLLDYLIKQLNQKKEKFRTLSVTLQSYSLHDVPALIDLQIQDVRIVQLVQLIENNILRKNKINIDGHTVFTMATNIINSQTKVVGQGLDFIQNKVHHQLDGWHYSTA